MLYVYTYIHSILNVRLNIQSLYQKKCPVRSSHPQIQKKHFSPSQMMLQQKTIVFAGYRGVFDMRER